MKLNHDTPKQERTRVKSYGADRKVERRANRRRSKLACRVLKHWEV